MEAKLCSKCKIEKPLDEFYWFKKQSVFSAQCKECTKARALARDAANPEAARARNIAQYHKHHEKRMAYHAEYRAKPENREKAKQVAKKWREDHQERSNDHKRKHWYGLVDGQYKEMHTAQGGKCAACGDMEVIGRRGGLHVDHNHTTGKVRGLICNNCNLALGHALDSKRRLQFLIDYLERTG